MKIKYSNSPIQNLFFLLGFYSEVYINMGFHNILTNAK